MLAWARGDWYVIKEIHNKTWSKKNKFLHINFRIWSMFWSIKTDAKYERISKVDTGKIKTKHANQWSWVSWEYLNFLSSHLRAWVAKVSVYWKLSGMKCTNRRIYKRKWMTVKFVQFAQIFKENVYIKLYVVTSYLI